MHHSAERLDTYGTFYFSPLDMVGWTLLSTFSITVIGVTPQAVTIMLLMTTFFNMFQHSNIKTPRWLGYFIQRPESHTMHHAKGIHRYNYSDLPLFDILFGTFHNPKDFEHETGFYQGASSRIGDMLLFKDVSEPQKEK
jgi:sterol desaturase/sphingolipid hydroxylase (fatty acid hydroxylase superfamily)